MIGRRAALLLAALPFGALAGDADLANAIRDQVGDGAPEERGIVLRAPATAENGGQVPITVIVDSPQTAALHVAAIHVFATRNPTPGVASFRLTPALARAEIQTRIRLAENQAIVVVAQMSDGSLRRASAEVRVAAGGCV